MVAVAAEAAAAVEAVAAAEAAVEMKVRTEDMMRYKEARVIPPVEPFHNREVLETLLAKTVLER